MTTATLVSCSYRPDLQRCITMCRSVDQWVAPEHEHVLIVPRRDRHLFAPLEGKRRRILTSEEVMGGYFHYLPLIHHRLWISSRLRPVRGWLIQQIAKIGSAHHLDTDALIFVDSDVTFIRPFGIDDVKSGDRLRLYVEPGGGQLDTHLRWHRTAGRLLGLQGGYFGADYIHQVVVWHRPTAVAMCRHIEATTGKPWQLAFAEAKHAAEYILYGVYVEHVLNDHQHHVRDVTKRCLCSWDYSLSRPGEEDRFIGDLDDSHVALLIQSNERVPEEQQARILDRAVSAAGAGRFAVLRQGAR